MFIATAFAQDAAAGGGDSLMIQMLPLVLIFVVFYFLLIRPQQKKAKAHREMVGNLQRGDKVVTGGGLYATVAKVEDEKTVVLEIANGVRVKAARSTISELAAKTEPRRGDGDNSAKKDK